MSVIKLINYDQLYEVLEAVKVYVDHTVTKYLPLTGGTVSGSFYTDRYLGINAWEGYGSGKTEMWFNGTDSALTILGAEKIKIGSTPNEVLHTGNHYQHVLTLGGGTLTGRLSINKNNNTGYFEVGSDSVHIHNKNANIALNIMNTGILKFGNATVLHTSNYSDYVMPLSGGSFTGSVTLPNDKYIKGLTTGGLDKSILGITAKDNCVVGNVVTTLVLRTAEEAFVRIPVDGTDTDYTLYHAGNHVIKNHSGQTTGRNNPLGTIYTKMYDSDSSPHSYITRVTAMYNSETKEDYASFGLYNPAGDGASVNYINIYADRTYTKGYYRSADDFIILGGHRLTINSDEPSTKTKGDIWIQI